MRNQYSPQMICKAAAFMALVCIMTLFFKVPIPLGYAHLGNGIILLGGFLRGNPYAVWIGGIGSAMADLLGGYTEWIFPTLVIKGAMGYAIGFLSHSGKKSEKKSVKVLSFQAALSAVAGTAVMILGYGIATGFLGFEGQIQIVRNMIEDFWDERTNVVIDPVMGDDGKRYGTYTAELCQSMKQLIPYADILIPNVTEACLLTDTPFFLSSHKDDYFHMADCLQRMGAKKVVITGIDMGQWIGNAVFESENKPCIIRKKRIGGNRSGTGDLFQAMITGETIRGRSLPEAVKKTAVFIGKCMAITEELKIPDTDGVCFEMLL